MAQSWNMKDEKDFSNKIKRMKNKKPNKIMIEPNIQVPPNPYN